MKTIFVSYGTTESGDQMPMAAWASLPEGDAVMAYYKEAIPEEFEAFGDEYVASLIHVQEVEVL